MSKLKVDEIRSADRSVSSTANITLADNGNVGIGVGIGGTPDELLHLTSSTSLKPILKIENTNADHLNAQIHLVKNSASEADDDYLGQIDFKGLNDNDELIAYGRLQARAKDVSDGTEDGRVFIASMKNGTLEETLNIESGKVGIGITSPTADVEIRGSGNTTLGANGNLFVADGGTASQAADEGGQIAFGAWLNGDPSVPYQMAAIKGVTESSTTNANTGALIFGTRDQSSGTIERMRIGGTGSLNGTATGTPWELSGYNGHLYLKNNVDVNASGGEVFATDKSGNHTQISPHNFSLIPDGPSEELAWSYYSERNKSTEDGNDPSAPTKKINVDMARVIRLVEQLSGETLIYTSED